MVTAVDQRQAGAVRPLWVPALQLLVAALCASADRRRRGLVGNLLTEIELSRVADCACASAIGGDASGLAAVAPNRALAGSRLAHSPEWQVLLDEAQQLSWPSVDDE